MGKDRLWLLHIALYATDRYGREGTAAFSGCKNGMDLVLLL